MRGAVAALPHGAWLLAVSGGRDSMVLLDAFATGGGGDVRAVATFDHGTGEAATRAARLVERVAGRHGLAFVAGREVAGAGAAQEARDAGIAQTSQATEATWRLARWRFLADAATGLGATVVTAHTLDDQVETVALRILRGAGARGLAGMLAAPAGRPLVVRPFLALSRSHIDAYASSRRLEFIDDPSNDDRRHARNRMRHDILPALERAQPGFRAWLASLSVRAARWREGVESLVNGLIAEGLVEVRPDGSLVVRAAPLAALGAEEWRVLWPALAARAGLTLDRRGVERAAGWAASAASEGDSSGAARGAIQLAGGAEIARTRGAFVLRRPHSAGLAGNASPPAAAIY